MRCGTELGTRRAIATRETDGGAEAGVIDTVDKVPAADAAARGLHHPACAGDQERAERKAVTGNRAWAVVERRRRMGSWLAAAF